LVAYADAKSTVSLAVEDNDGDKDDVDEKEYDCDDAGAACSEDCSDCMDMVMDANIVELES
jgi:hypothetical protein